VHVLGHREQLALERAAASYLDAAMDFEQEAPGDEKVK
jgi:hypothetical protein